MISLDSDFIIDFLNGSEITKGKLKELLVDREQIVTTAINSLEIYVGIVEVDGIGGTKVKMTRDFLRSLNVLPFDSASSERAALIIKSLEKLGRPIGLKDSLIGGILLENNATILTRNIKHFERIAGLTIETW